MTTTYPLHIQILKEEFEERASRNSGYSLRAFARDLGVSPAALSLLLNMKRGISEQKAGDIATRLGFTLYEKEEFLLSVTSQHSRSPGRREESLKKIEQMSNRANRQKKIAAEAFVAVQNWYCLAILELLELDHCIHKPIWFAEKLGLNVVVIKNALDNLTRAGLIEFSKGKYRALTEESTTEEDVPSQEIKNFHAQVMKRAEQSLFNDAVNDREFINMTLAFPEKEMQEAKKMIRDFQQAFADRFYAQTKKKRNSVYQLAVQFYRLDKKEK
ncbi:TIGR02147 family protein [Bdellovibrio sp. ArHS]|uniref:TIGR02147 family protein n=1 Tax=Bdellovibrio sp. ArHS TaxID=1569284 RepID=UPI000AF915C7|nr:TIGR02147 family protein [Bdellovibrio sp. ArHS]